jgi:cytochrome oxidase Cu insertion factor (SCO1/SenC/PrrC family)
MAAAMTLLLGVAAPSAPVPPELHPFTDMSALPVTPPAPAPDVTFHSLDGRPLRLAEFRGRPVLLTFFTTW